MARCCGGATCECVITQGDNVNVTGVGTPEDPYVITVVSAPTSTAWVSTDGSFGLPAPTGVGGEFVITANALEDIMYDGVAL